MEQFYTIQGEGKYSGHAAYFIRLAGCDVGCVWCDVKDSWDASQHPTQTIESLVQKANQNPAEIVVITGGEPAMYDLTALCSQLKESGKRVHIETSGAHPIRGDFDWVTFSPKKFKPPLPEAFQKAHELKVIVFNKSDLEWAQSLSKDVHNDCVLLLQPEWSKRDKMHDLVVDFVKRNPQWHISLQTHKYLGID